MKRRPVSRATAAERRLRALALFDAALSAAGWAAKYGPPAAEPEFVAALDAASHQAAVDFRDGVKFQRNVYRHECAGLPASFFTRSYDDRNIPMGAVIAAIVGCDGTVRWQEAAA